MLERYTEKARRVIFFARYEASQYGNPHIETEHLLLGLFREDHRLAQKLLDKKGGVPSLREEDCRKNRRCPIRRQQSRHVDPGLGSPGKT
jgi:ATP-dependent Clp protease ATP-binding subunit ClpA